MVCMPSGIALTLPMSGTPRRFCLADAPAPAERGARPEETGSLLHPGRTRRGARGRPPAPAWVEGLRIEDAIPRADHGLRTQAICDAETRSKGLIEGYLRMTAAKTGSS